MTMTIDEIDTEIAMWERRRDIWLQWDGEVAVRGFQECLDEIDELQRLRDAAEQTERKLA